MSTKKVDKPEPDNIRTGDVPQMTQEQVFDMVKQQRIDDLSHQLAALKKEDDITCSRIQECEMAILAQTGMKAQYEKRIKVLAERFNWLYREREMLEGIDTKAVRSY